MAATASLFRIAAVAAAAAGGRRAAATTSGADVAAAVGRAAGGLRCCRTGRTHSPRRGTLDISGAQQHPALAGASRTAHSVLPLLLSNGPAQHARSCIASSPLGRWQRGRLARLRLLRVLIQLATRPKPCRITPRVGDRTLCSCLAHSSVAAPGRKRARLGCWRPGGFAQLRSP